MGGAARLAHATAHGWRWLIAATSVRAALALVAARLGGRERAVVLHPLLEPFAERHAVVAGIVYLAPVARALGELAGALGLPRRHTQAEDPAS